MKNNKLKYGLIIAVIMAALFAFAMVPEDYSAPVEYNRTARNTTESQLIMFDYEQYPVYSNGIPFPILRNASATYCNEDGIEARVNSNPARYIPYEENVFDCKHYSKAIVEDFEQNGELCHPVIIKFTNKSNTQNVRYHMCVAFEIAEDEFLFADTNGTETYYFTNVKGFYEGNNRDVTVIMYELFKIDTIYRVSKWEVAE